MDCLFLLQEIFLIQGLNPGLPHCGQTLYPLSHQGSPHTSKVMLKILQARLQLYMNRELPDVQAVFQRGRGTNIHWIIKKARRFQKNIYFASLTMLKPLTVCITIKLWKILKEMGAPDHITCLLRNLHAGQEGTVRTGHGTADWFQIGKAVPHGYMLSSCLFNLYVEYIM